MIDVSDTMLTAFINDALREIYHYVGDEAYFIRKTIAVSVAQPPNKTTLPSAIKRLYRLEVPHAPTENTPWTLLYHDSNGDMVITAERGGEHIAHYLVLPPDLAAPTDTTALPPHHIELLVVAVCRRLAAAVGNAALLETYIRDTDRLMSILKRDCMKFSGQRHEALTVSRQSWAQSERWSN